MAPEARTSWTLFLGPGERLASIQKLFAAAGEAGETPPLEPLSDLADLLLRPTREDPGLGRLILDVDALPREDLGLLYRIRRRCPGLEIVLVGQDASRPGARELLAVGEARWQPWPLDIEQLGGLARQVPRSAQTPEPGGRPEAGAKHPATSAPPEELPKELPEERPQSSPATPPAPPPDSKLQSTPTAVDERRAPGSPEFTPAVEIEPDPAPARPALPPEQQAELSHIQHILDGGDEWVVGGRDPFAEPDRIEARTSEPQSWPADASTPWLGLAPRRAGASQGASWRTRLPDFYRAQIADLADIAQRLKLSTMTLEPGQHAGPGGEDSAVGSDRLRQLEAEVWRLVQFARTLGYLVAPPAPGEQVIDLGTLLDELLAGLTSEVESAPRFLRDGEDSIAVRSDKSLLVGALDAVLQVARVCSTREDTVLVTTTRRPVEGVRGGWAAVLEVLFPAGPLADLRPDEVLEPYALRRRLSTIGPNALAAAEGILRGQGGGLELTVLEPTRWRWRVILPLDSLPQGGASPPTRRQAPAPPPLPRSTRNVSTPSPPNSPRSPQSPQSPHPPHSNGPAPGTASGPPEPTSGPFD